MRVVALRGRVDVVLYSIVGVVVGGLLLVACGVFIIQMQHPDDNNMAWLPKLIVLLGLYLSCGVVLMLPFDASMSQSCEMDPNCSAISVLSGVWQALFIAIGCMALICIPFAYFWYETDDEEDMLSRVCTAVCWSIVNAFVFVAILLAMYITSGFVDLRVTVLEPYKVPDDSGNYAWPSDIGFFDPSARPPAWESVKDVQASLATQTIRTSWMVYILALLSFIGWCLMTVFAGIGMVSLPMDMISAWYNRPRPNDLKQFAEKKLQLKKRCEELIAVGKESNEKFKSQRNNFRKTRFTNKFRKMVIDLEDEMALLNLCYKKNEINPLLPWFNLIGGIFCAVITISWWLQLILEVFLAGLTGPYLSSIFTELSSAFPLFGIVAYGTFAFYILLASVKGSITFAGRFFMISMHPMKANGTMMNSFLFNVAQVPQKSPANTRRALLTP